MENTNSISFKIKRWFRKQFISLKRNFYNVPLFVILMTVFFFLCATYVHSQCVARVNYVENDPFIATMNGLNAFFLFCITLAGILGAVSYLKYMGNKSIFMLILFEVLTVVQAALEAFFYIGVSRQLTHEDVTTSDSAAKYIELETESISLMIIHFVLLGICFVLGIVSPFIQKALKNVKLARIEDNV